MADPTPTTLSISYLPLNTGTDTPQDVLEEVILAVRRRGGEITDTSIK